MTQKTNEFLKNTKCIIKYNILLKYLISENILNVRIKYKLESLLVFRLHIQLSNRINVGMQIFYAKTSIKL